MVLEKGGYLQVLKRHEVKKLHQKVSTKRWKVDHIEIGHDRCGIVAVELEQDVEGPVLAIAYLHWVLWVRSYDHLVVKYHRDYVGLMVVQGLDSNGHSSCLVVHARSD